MNSCLQGNEQSGQHLKTRENEKTTSYVMSSVVSTKRLCFDYCFSSGYYSCARHSKSCGLSKNCLPFCFYVCLCHLTCMQRRWIVISVYYFIINRGDTLQDWTAKKDVILQWSYTDSQLSYEFSPMWEFLKLFSFLSTKTIY